MFMQTCLMLEEKVNEIQMCTLRVSSGGTSDSDNDSEEMNDKIPRGTPDENGEMHN